MARENLPGVASRPVRIGRRLFRGKVCKWVRVYSGVDW